MCRILQPRLLGTGRFSHLLFLYRVYSNKGISWPGGDADICKDTDLSVSVGRQKETESTSPLCLVGESKRVLWPLKNYLLFK